MHRMHVNVHTPFLETGVDSVNLPSRFKADRPSQTSFALPDRNKTAFLVVVTFRISSLCGAMFPSALGVEYSGEPVSWVFWGNY